MRGKYLSLLVLPLLVFSFLVLSGSQIEADKDKDHKIDICHATSAHNNPYTTNNVDKNATAGGHGDHTGPIWYQGIVGGWGDIIPSYSYDVLEFVGKEWECPTSNSAYGGWGLFKTCYKIIGGHLRYAYPVLVDQYELVTYQYPGLNWTTQGQAIWNNGCEIPYQVCSSTVRAFGEWSEWMIDPVDDTQEYREREVSAVDAKDMKTVCNGPVTQTETRYRECSRTVRVFGEWSEWSVDSEDETVEVRTREAKAVDSKNSEVTCAGPIIQKETRDREIPYEVCSFTSDIYGDWSEWAVDPSDSTREYRERTVKVVDSEDSEVECDEPKVETEYRDIEIPQDDDPDVLGEKDIDTPEVKSATTVVLAETASTSNIGIYVIQMVLVLSTLISGTLFTKKYII